MEDRKCCLCGTECKLWHDGAEGWGNNPWPLAEDPDRCCDDCNWEKVIPARLAQVNAD